MFVSIPTRQRSTLRWATPLLFALLWGAYLWASTRPESARLLWLLDWGALTGGEAIGSTSQALWLQGHWHRPIGRATCRDRVCQYVTISVVGVALQKKQHNSTFMLKRQIN